MKQHGHSNKPPNNTTSFVETGTASTVNLRINSLHTESKAYEHFRKSRGGTARVTTVKKVGIVTGFHYNMMRRVEL